MKSRFSALVMIAASLAFALAACGEETSGLPCQDSTECPQVECGQGVHVQVCIDQQCVTDQNDACKLADTGGGGTGGAP